MAQPKHSLAALRLKWHQEYSSAWVPANSFRGFQYNRNNLEETCVKSTTQVRVLGISYGHELLGGHIKDQLRNQFGQMDSMDKQDNDVLKNMVEDLGVIYSSFVHSSTSLFLECSESSGYVRLGDWTGRDNQLWTRSWDNCFENKTNGLVLAPGNNYSRGPLDMANVDQMGDRDQKWKLDNNGRFSHKSSNMFLCFDHNERYQLSLLPYSAARNDFWKFHCMGSMKTTDSFVQFTPWQNMMGWG